MTAGPIRDPSSPPAVTTNSATSLTSASFTPPANSLITVRVTTDTPTAAVLPSTAVTNTGSGLGTWTNLARQANTTVGGQCDAWVCQVGASPTAVTITWANGSSAQDADMYIDVWTNVPASQSGAAVSSGQSSTQTNNQSLTTTGNYSLVLAAVCDDNLTGTITSADSESTNAQTNINTAAIRKLFATLASGTSVPINFVAGGAAPALSYVLFEVLGALIPIITAQPANQTAASGGTATFSVTATASGGSLSYQWQSAPITGLYGQTPGTWSNISGATSASYTTGTLSSSNNGSWYRCIVTDSNGSNTTAFARVFITGINDTGKGRLQNTGWWRRAGQRGRANDYQVIRKTTTGYFSQAASIAMWLDWIGLSASSNTPINVSDSGSGADAIGAINAALIGADSGSGADAPGIAASFTLAESGSGADAAVLTIQILGADTGSGADAIASIAVSFTAADAGSGSDAVGSIAAALEVDDTGSGADAVALTVVITLPDAGSAADAVVSILAALSAADTGSGIDAIGSIAASMTGADSGSGTDAPGISVVASVADSGSGSDAAVLTIQIVGADIGSGADAVASIVAALTGADSGAGVDAIGSIIASFLLAELGSGADGITVSASGNIFTINDAGSGVDAIAAITASMTAAELGLGSDAVGGISVAFSISDSGSGADSVALTLIVTQNDAGAGADAIGPISVTVNAADSGIGIEGAMIAAALQLLDSALGIDIATVTVPGALTQAAHMVRAIVQQRRFRVAVDERLIRVAPVTRLTRFKILN